jgi:hypothetical protein
MTVVPTDKLLGTGLLGNTDLDGSGAAFQATDPATGAALIDPSCPPIRFPRGPSTAMH